MKSLEQISKKYNTTKKEGDFLKVYEEYFKSFRNKKNKILEIGFTKFSLGMFRDYFPKSIIVGLDIKKQDLKLKNVYTYTGDQTDYKILKKIVSDYKSFDIIIDDGSHVNSHIVTTFRFLFNYLKYHGLYFIEDLQTSYISKWGGDPYNMNNKNTTMNFLRSLSDSMHYQEFDDPFYKKNQFDGKIGYVHIYRNLGIVKKEKNIYESNLCFKNSVYLGMIKKRKNFALSNLRDFKRYIRYLIKHIFYKILVN